MTNALAVTSDTSEAFPTGMVLQADTPTGLIRAAADAEQIGEGKTCAALTQALRPLAGCGSAET